MRHWLGIFLIPLLLIIVVGLGYLFTPASAPKIGGKAAVTVTVPELPRPPAPTLITPPASPTAAPLTSGSKLEAKKIDISSWVPELSPRTWLLLLLLTAAAILAHAKKWIAAAIAFAAGVALLTFPSINSEEIVGGSWRPTLSALLSNVQANAAEWGPQQWLTLAAGVLGIILLLPSRPTPATPTDKKTLWGAVALAVAGVLLIAPPITFTGDWQSKGQAILANLTAGSANPLPADCDEHKGPLLKLNNTDLPFPNCKFRADLYEGALQFKNKKGKTFKLTADEDAQWPKGFEAVLVRGQPSARVQFTFRPK
jgi:hypothetical protein